MNRGAPPRVLFVTTAQSGGAERVLVDLLDEMDPRAVAGVALTHDGPLRAQLEAMGIRPTILPTTRRSRIRSLATVIRDVAPGLVHANGISPALDARIAATGSRVPVLWMRHDMTHHGTVSVLLGTACAHVVAVSETTARRTSLRPGRRTVVMNGLSGSAPSPTRGRQIIAGLGDGSGPTIGVIGRLCPGKGQLDALEAFAPLPRAIGARLLIVGGDDHFWPGYGSALRARAEELGIDSSVILTGHQADARDLIAGLDVVWVPSTTQQTRDRWQEGFGLVAAEALRAGTPVVVSDNGALPEIVADCGVIVGESRPDELRCATLALLQDDARREELVRKGRERARTTFALSTAVRGMTDVYRQVAR